MAADLTSLLPLPSVYGPEFTTMDGIHFTRQLHGKERMSAITSKFGEGLGQLVGVGAFCFKQNLSKEQLFTHVRAAWIRLRFQAPWIAYRCRDTLNAEPNSFHFEYKRSTRPNEAEAWAEETLIWRTESLSLEEWEVAIKQTYWDPGSGHFGVEMHIAKGKEPNEWFFMYTWPHQTADARGMFAAVDHLLRNLQEELAGNAVPYRCLPWGEEISRLTPIATFTVPDVGAEDMPEPSQKPEPVQFERILIEKRPVTGPNIITHSIRLSSEQTKAVMINCKKYKASLTAVVSSILVLADVEMILQLAADASPNESARIMESFRTSDMFPVGVNIADMRSHVYPKYAKALGGCTTGGIVNVAFPTLHNMDHVRRCFHVGADGKMTRNLSDSAFWGGVVPDTQNEYKLGGRQPPHAFHVSSNLADTIVPQINQLPVTSQSIMASSLGSVERMGIFTPFSPVNASEYPSSLFEIRDWIFGMSTTNCPGVVIHTWEYNGRLVVNLQASSKWQTEKSFGFFVEAVRARLEQITSARATL